MEKEENVLQCGENKTEHAAEAEREKEKGKGSAVLGKFRDVDALKEAYSALEAEFTRRSQRLKELEKRADNSLKTDDAPSKAEKPEEEAKPDAEPAPAQSLSVADTAQRTTAQKSDTAKEKTENELYEAARNSEAVRLRIIGDYLSSLRGADAPLMRGGTGTLAPSPVRAKSISEAGTMALNYFKKDRQA